jgi:mono/diheme cytochrome c family protein
LRGQLVFRVDGQSVSWSWRRIAVLVSSLVLALLAAAGWLASRWREPARSAAAVASNRRWMASQQSKSVTNPVRPSAEALEESETLFRLNCAGCHGENGDGNGPASVVLPTKAANFRDAKTMASMTDGELFWKMSTGRAPMPAWNDLLTVEQRWQLVNYIRTFARASATPAPE